LDDIWPPTPQNQASIEDDLHRFVASRLDLDDQHLTWLCEQAIRNYDPCISCATHFLDLTVDRTRPGRTRCDEGCQGAPLRAVQVRWCLCCRVR
jgi:coenzyme F420-reducing hydrogenase alpha subunit